MTVGRIFGCSIIVGLFLLPLTPLFVTSSFLFPFITGKGFFFRIVTEIVLALWLVLALRVPAYRPKSSWIFKAFAALIVVLTLATVWGANPYHSFWSNYERMEGLVSYLHLFAYFLVLISVMKTEKLWGWFLHGSLTVNLTIGIYALFQLGGKLAIHQGSTRLDATLGNSSYLAVYELFHIFLLAFLIFRLLNDSRWRKELGRKLLGAGYLILLILNLFILYQTETRGAILGLIGGAFITALWLAIFSPTRTRPKRWAVGFIVVLIALTGLFFAARESNFIKNDPTLSRLAAISLTEKTTRSRFMVWEMSWRGFKERPILGWGPENYTLVFNKYYNPLMYDQEQWFDRSHNVVFDWLINAGALGLLSYLSLFIIAIYYSVKLKRSGIFSVDDQAAIAGLLTAYFIHNFFVFDQLVSHLMFFGFLAYLHTRAIAGGPSEFPPVPSVGQPTQRGIIVFGSAAAAAGLVLVFYFINLKPAFASHSLINALSWQNDIKDRNGSIVRRADPVKSLDYFVKTFAYDTFGSTEAAEQLMPAAFQIASSAEAPAETRQRYLELAAEKLEAEIKRAPNNARYYFFAGGFYAQSGQEGLALKRLEKARELSPKKQGILFNLGAVYFAKNQTEEAIAVFREAYESAPVFDQARNYLINIYVETKQFGQLSVLWEEKVRLEPENVNYHGALGLAYFYNGQTPKAIAEFRKVIELDPNFKTEAERVIREVSAGRNPYP